MLGAVAGAIGLGASERAPSSDEGGALPGSASAASSSAAKAATLAA